MLERAPSRADDVDRRKHFLLWGVNKNIPLAMVLALVGQFQLHAIYFRRVVLS
jgi:hypothetical protein